MANLDTGYTAAGVAKTYTTAPLALAAAASTGADNCQLYYGDTTMAPLFVDEVSDATTTVMGLQGMLNAHEVVFYHNIAQKFWYKMQGDLSGQTTQAIIQNITVISTDTNIEDGVLYNDTTGGGAGVRVTNCRFQGFRKAISIAGGDANVCQVDNCELLLNEYGIDFSVVGKAYYNTCALNKYGLDASNTAAVVTNNACLWNWQADFVNVGSAVITYCASTDTSATGTGSITGKKDPDDLDLWMHNDNSVYALNFRILATSDLYGAGTPVSGITTDCDGNTRDSSTPSIGWHEGTASAYPSSATTPAAPDIAVAWLTATSFRVTFSNSASGVTNYVRYATTSDGGDTWSDGGSRSGDGTKDVTGLTEGGIYYVVGYSVESTGVYKSDPSNVVEITMVAAASSTPTLAVSQKIVLKSRKVLRETRDEKVTQSIYNIGVKGTLAKANLEPGDALPDNSSAYIEEASLGKAQGTAEELATVVAREFRAWS